MKRHILILILGFSLVTCSSDDAETSLGTWNQFNDFPGPVRNGGIAFSVLGKGYWGLGGNTTNSFMRDFWSYDADKDAWVQKADFPFSLPPEVAVAIGEKAYLLNYGGGLYEYDPVNDSWKYLSSFPGGARPGITGFAIGGNAYFGTGNVNVLDENNTLPPQKDFWKYDPKQNTWTQIADFPGVARTAAVSFVIGEKGYVGLGFNGIGAPPIYSDLWSYDPKTGNWDQIADLPINNALVGIVFSNASKGYIGLPTNDTHRGRVFEYDPGRDTWRAVNMFPSGNSLETHSFTIKNRTFVLGGWWSEISPQVWEFVP